MNKKICFYTPPFPRVVSYYDMVDIAAEYGMETVEGFCNFEFQEPDIEAAKRVREYADSRNIKFSCFSVFCDLVGDDREKNIARLKQYAAVAAELGSPYLHHTVASELNDPEKVLPYKEEFFSRGIAAVREVFDHAEKLGVRTIFEDQGYLFNGVEGFGRFLREVGRDVGIVADFGNIYHVEEDIVSFIEAFSEKICHVHLKDVFLSPAPQNGSALRTSKGNYMHEAQMGEGCVALDKGLRLLSKLGYNGCYALEYGAGSDDSDTVDKALSYIDSRLKG